MQKYNKKTKKCKKIIGGATLLFNGLLKETLLLKDPQSLLTLSEEKCVNQIGWDGFDQKDNKIYNYLKVEEVTKSISPCPNDGLVPKLGVNYNRFREIIITNKNSILPYMLICYTRKLRGIISGVDGFTITLKEVITWGNGKKKKICRFNRYVLCNI